MNRSLARLDGLPSRIVILVILCFGLLALPERAGAGRAQATPPLCTTINSPKDLHKAGTTVLTTIEQGYRCLLRHYVTGKGLDDRVLLRGAYNGLVSQLRQLGVSLPGATLPALTGDREADWQVFSTAYTTLIKGLPQIGFIQGALAQEALLQMTTSLHDDHTSYLPPEAMQPAIAQLSDSGPIPSFGIVTSPITPTAPLFITDVYPGSPAAAAGLKPGDTITAISGSAPFSNGSASIGLFHFALPTIGTPVTLTIHRPVSDTVLTVTLSPKNVAPPDTSTRLVAGSIAYVRLYQFTKHGAKKVFDAIKGLGAGVHGVVLDLRGNEGGYADQAVQLLSAFVHQKVLAVSVDGKGKRDPQRTNNKVPLLHQPLAVLIDGGSASSSEIVAGTVRDFGLGRLIGERTGGALAGAEFFGLGDGGGMEITEAHILGPKGERIDGIGVPPDDRVPTTAADLSAGHDPAVDQAVRYLKTAAASGA